MRLSRRLAASAAAAIVALAVALRAARIANGLPEFVEEAAPFRWALAMWSHGGGRIDWNPHHFLYPSLTLYLHLALQRAHALAGTWTGAFHGPADYQLAVRMDPTPMVMLARSLDIAADAVSVWLTFRIGERARPGAGLIAALLAALSPILITTSSAIFTDPIMLVLSLAALDRMQVHGAQPSGRPWAMAIWTGLAVGAKYPAAVLLLPLAWTLVAGAPAEGGSGVRRGLVRLLPVVGVVALVFLATSPYVLIDRAAFLRDVGFGRVLVSEGLLGATAGPSGTQTLSALARDLGAVATVLAIAGFVLALARPRSAAALVAITAFGFLAPVVLSPLRFERYLLGVIPAACVLAGLAATWAASLVPARARGATLTALIVAAALPVAARAWATARATSTTTESLARRWIASNVSRDALLMMEPYGPLLRTRRQALDVEDLPFLDQASPALRARYESRPWWSAVQLPVLVAGTCIVRVHPPSGPAVDLPVFEHASDFNRVLYDTRLLAGVDYVLTTDAVRGRFEADTTRYAAPCAFYRYLDQHATVAARFRSSRSASGPDILVYQLAADTTARLAALDRWWWAERIPEDFRRQAGALLAPGVPAIEAVELAPGVPAPWVLAAHALYDIQLRRFAEDLAWNLLALDRPAPAGRLMDAEQAILPWSQLACMFRMEACRDLGDWQGARAAFERTAAVTRAAAMDSSLVSGYAEALEHTGARERALALRDSLAGRARR